MGTISTPKLIGNYKLVPLSIRAKLRNTAKMMDCKFLVEKSEYTSHYVDIVCQLKQIGGYPTSNTSSAFNVGEIYYCIEYTAGMNNITKIVDLETIQLLFATKN